MFWLIVFIVFDWRLSEAASLTPPRTNIVGGKNAESVPYQCSLQIQGRHVCGAAIISPSTVLTAAHCCKPENDYQIRCGSNLKDSGGQFVAVSCYRHELYQEGYKGYDLCICYTTVDLKYGPTVQPIKICNTTVAVANDPVILTGWGRTTEGGNVSTLLQIVTLPIITHSECKAKYDAYAPKYVDVVTTKNICAGLAEGGKDTCQGDSGGPMKHQHTNELIGIVSWGCGCARSCCPGVYTHICSFKSWILYNCYGC